MTNINSPLSFPKYGDYSVNDRIPSSGQYIFITGRAPRLGFISNSNQTVPYHTRGCSDNFFKQLKTKLNSCKTSKTYQSPVLSNKSCKIELNRLRTNFVITVVDKAAGNFAFTCKKFYFLRLAEELGLHNLNPGNETYNFTQENEMQIVDKITSDLIQFRINPSLDEKKFLNSLFSMSSAIPLFCLTID